MRTTFSSEIWAFGVSDTTLTQNTAENVEVPVTKWPVKVKHRGKVFARIYRPGKGRDSYRVAWKAAGKRQMRSFKNYSGEKGAKKFADKLVGDLARQSSITQLTGAQADDALAALRLLATFREETGWHLSLTTVVSDYCPAKKKLGNRTLAEVITSFMLTSANVTPKSISDAVTEFLTGNAQLAESVDGKRAQLSKKYVYIREKQLRRFADTFPGHAVNDLDKAHLDNFISTLGEQKTKSRNKRKILSAKSRNHYRGVIRQFLSWCVRKDYLSPAHRLFEADAMRSELANTAEIEFYAPQEFQRMLNVKEESLLPLRPLIAIGGLAGLRTAELLRLDWVDVWRVPGHIEITARKSKTRQRRLVEIGPALAAWLKPYQKKKAGQLWQAHEITFQQKFVELCEKAKVPRKPNGLRHSFCSYHLARDANENLTAAQAGNSPAMIHRHYKALVMKNDAEKWFAVKPAG